MGTLNIQEGAALRKNIPMVLRPPITYYGGKQRLSGELVKLIPAHRLYVEAFMGGGALFFRKEPSQSEIINDVNGEVSNFYSVVQNDFNSLQRKIKGTLHSRSIHDEALLIYNNPKKHKSVERAWAFWVVTNQGFGARIGSWALGKDNKMGKSLAAKRENFTRQFAERLKHVQIESKDALEIIRHYDSEETFFYLDPPYFNSDCGHYKGYSQEDYKQLLDLLSSIKGKFLLSSYPSSILDEYMEKNCWQKNEKQQQFCVNHFSKKGKTEVMVFNYELEIECNREGENQKNSDEILDRNENDDVQCVQDFNENSKSIVGVNVAESAMETKIKRLQQSEMLWCFGESENTYDPMPAMTPSQSQIFSDPRYETLERIYRSLSNGIRSAKAQVPRAWLFEKKLSIEATGACFNSGQIHHRKSEAFKEELLRSGFMKKSSVGTNNGQIPYTVFGIFSVMFPLRNEKDEVVNFYSVGIKKTRTEFLNRDGIYPQYPHEMTKRLFIVPTIMDAATLLESRMLDNREAVMALFDGEFLVQHQEAIGRLKHLEEIIVIEESELEQMEKGENESKKNSNGKPIRKVA